MTIAYPLYAVLRNSSGTEIGTGADPLRVDPTGTTTQPVSGTFWQATQPVSIASAIAVTGPLTDTQLRNSAIAVSGTFFQATQPVSIASTIAVSGTVDQGTGGLSAWKVDGSGVTQPVSGTVTANAGSGTFAVSGTFFQATQPVSGTVTANAGTGTMAVSAAALPLPSGAATQTTLASILTNTPAAGQAVMASSSPVVIASNQTAIPASQSGTWTVQPGNTANTTPWLTTISQGGNTAIVGADGSLNVKLISPDNLDAFGRLVVAAPETIFDGKLLFDAQPLIWDDQQTSGAGTTTTYNANQASQTIAVGASTAGTRVRQTFERYAYQAGKSQDCAYTGILGAPATGITRRIGSFDGNNGFYFESSPTVINVVRRTKTSGAVVDNAVAQSSWNLDKMDGTGASGITLDFSKDQIFLIQYQWLGVGSIWYGVNVNGRSYWVHRMDIANSLTVVSTSIPNLPVRYEISNSGTGGAASLTQICSTVISNGGSQKVGHSRAIYNSALTTLNNNSWYPLIAVRIGATYVGTSIDIDKISVNCQSTADYTWRLVLNPTVVGTALSFSAVTNSAIEAALASTNATTVTGGTDVEAETTQQSTSGVPAQTRLGALRLGHTIAGTADIIVLAVRRETGTTETFTSTMSYSERY